MGGDDHGLGQSGPQRLADAFLGRADIADHGAGPDMWSEGLRRIAHCADGHAENDEFGVGHGLRDRITDRADKPALRRARPHIGVGVPSGRLDTGQVLAHRQPDRATDKAQPDDGDAADGHAVSPHSLRSTPAISSICLPVPMVMRSALGRPCPGKWRTA